MNVYGTQQLRNVVILGHGGAGKSTVAEAMAYVTGAISKMGKISDGNTISDYDKEEIKRIVEGDEMIDDDEDDGDSIL